MINHNLKTLITNKSMTIYLDMCVDEGCCCRNNGVFNLEALMRALGPGVCDVWRLADSFNPTADLLLLFVWIFGNGARILIFPRRFASIDDLLPMLCSSVK